MKTCTKCGIEQKLSKFPKDRRYRGGHSTWCYSCKATNQRSHYSPEERNRRRLLSNYRMTPEQYDDLLKKQGGVCAACGETSEKTLHIDHAHACCPGARTCGGCVRGLLCGKCNRALGLLDEDPEKISGLIRYLSNASNQEIRPLRASDKRSLDIE